MERQINLSSPDKDLGDSMLPSCGDQREELLLDKGGQLISFNLLKHLHRLLQFVDRLHMIVGSSSGEGKSWSTLWMSNLSLAICGLEFKPTSVEPPVTAPCCGFSLHTSKLSLQPKRSGWSYFSFPFQFPAALSPKIDPTTNHTMSNQPLHPEALFFVVFFFQPVSD